MQVENAATTRAAQAAARVAARYAKAPSYSDMQAAEARVAVRAAEIATKVALEAQAVAETALAGLHAASVEQPSRGPAVVETFAPPARKPEQIAVQVEEQAEPQAYPQIEPRKIEPPTREHAPAMTQLSAEPVPLFTPEARREQSYGIRWDPDMPVRQMERKPPPVRVQDEFELEVEDWWSPADVTETLRGDVVEPESTHANLIQFPRELVATRKMRPRLAEAPASMISEAEGQLSIFEVDPRSISTEVDTGATGPESPASTWSAPDWSGIKLDAQPAQERLSAVDALSSAKALHLAPVGLRLMATVVDCALILACFGAAGFLAASNFQHPPAGKSLELLGLVALTLVGLAYYAVFFSLAVCTPGMRYAGIGLCTFDDQSPTRAQLRRRLGAMVLSLLPMGLGVVWSVFDEDHLSWHDRFSQTYLRKR